MITSHGENRPDGDVWAALLPTRIQAPPKPEESPPGTPWERDLRRQVRNSNTSCGDRPPKEQKAPSPGTPRKNSQSKEGEKP